MSLPLCVTRSRYSRPWWVMTNALRPPSSICLGPSVGIGSAATARETCFVSSREPSRLPRQRGPSTMADPAAAAMKSDVQVVQHLNKLLFNGLTATNQYFLHARMFGNWGLKKLEEYEKKESIDEMKHADRLIERILFLEGLPNLQDLGKLLIGENAQEALKCDLDLERAARPVLQEAIAYCETVKDYISREIFERILESEEEHIDWLETQLGLIDQTGLQNWLQSQSGSAS